MTPDALEATLFDDNELAQLVVDHIVEAFYSGAQPSAWEMLSRLEGALNPKVRWVFVDALRQIVADRKFRRSLRDYASSLLNAEDLTEVIQGKRLPGKEIESSIDQLLREGAAYRTSDAFQEMVSFMANFKEYAPYNNMLVRIQNPGCAFYATEKDWDRRFNRRLIEDAKPMLILAPMHPVMLVFDIDQTFGAELPEDLLTFAKFEGAFDGSRLGRLIENAARRDHIRIDLKSMTSTLAGFVTSHVVSDKSKLRIVINDQLDLSSCFGVVCHELAHAYLGHLGGDVDGWWPARGNLSKATRELEAEAVAYIVSRRVGLTGSSPRYVSRYVANGAMPKNISLDLIAKVAGRIEDMTTRTMPPRPPARRKAKGRQQ